MNENTKDEIRHVEMKGPSFYSAESNIDREKKDIIGITPGDQDPLIYWHQVAQDAIKTAEKEREKAKYAVAGRDRADRELKNFTERLVIQAADKRSAIPLDLSRLIEMASDGTISLNVNISISGRKEGDNGDD